MVDTIASVSFEENVRISDIIKVLNNKFANKPITPSMVFDINMFIENYVCAWAKNNKVSFECETDVLNLIQNSIRIS